MKNHVNLNAFERTARANYRLFNNQNPSGNQVKLWMQQAEICNHQLALTSAKHSKFQVIPHKTGIGKTLALCAYAAELACTNRASSTETPKRMLIAAREKTQIDSLVTEINEQAGCLAAAAHYCGHYEKRENLEQFDVIVVTHEGIANALEQMEDDTLLKSHHSYLCTHRDLIVFDEAPETLFRDTQVPLDRLRHLKAFATLLKPGEHKEAVQYIDQLANFGEKQLPSEDRLLWTSEGDCPIPSVSRNQIEQFLQAYNEEAKKKHGCLASIDNERLAKSISNLAKTWMTLRNDKGDTVFETARFIWPENLKKPVVLDATGDLWSIWDYMKSGVNMVEPIAEARRYDAVTLHIRRENSLGKSCSPEMFNDQIVRMHQYFVQHPSTQNTLVISHKDRLSKAASIFSKRKGIHYANWFGLDGKNDWVDCTRAVITSLPYSPPFLAKLRARALKKPTSIHTQTLTDLGQHEIREMGGKLVQALNRTSCRRMVDKQGRCAKTDIYLPLPPGPVGDKLLQFLQDRMPGVRTKKWELPVSRTKGGKRSPKYIKFIHHLESCPKGFYATREIAMELDWSGNCLADFHRNLRNPQHWLHEELQSKGIVITQSGQGRGSRWFLQVP